MPRIRPSLFWKARSVSQCAAVLLPACRDLPSTLSELRWIREHVSSLSSREGSPIPESLRVWQLCEKRGKGMPLQYVLGTQPFGDLEIKCRPGVLIPRPETEAYTVKLAQILLEDKNEEADRKSSVNIIDICTGTGCIPLQLYRQLRPVFERVNVVGVDISGKALALARENLAYNTRLGLLQPQPPRIQQQQTIRFLQADVFSDEQMKGPLTLEEKEEWDLLTCNPPYISHEGYARDTGRSVRNHEPKLALVPDDRLHAAYVASPSSSGLACEPEDVFYARLLDIIGTLKPRRALMEVADMEQAKRVVTMLSTKAGLRDAYRDVQIWRDWPEDHDFEGDVETTTVFAVPVRGAGNGRSVYVRRSDLVE